MSVYTWDQALETGNEQIDEQNRQLFSLAEGLATAIDTVDDDEYVSDAIYRLTDHAVESFTSQELLMSFVDYPQMESHAGEHEQLTTEMTRLTSRYFADRPRAAAEIAEYIATWMREHIEASDRPVAEFIGSRD